MRQRESVGCAARRTGASPTRGLAVRSRGQNCAAPWPSGPAPPGSGLRSSTTGPNSASLPDYEQVNLSVVQKIDTGIFQGLEARLDVINLFDLKYQIRNGTGVDVGAPQFGPRRTVLAGLTQRF